MEKLPLLKYLICMYVVWVEDGIARGWRREKNKWKNYKSLCMDQEILIREKEIDGWIERERERGRGRMENIFVCRFDKKRIQFKDNSRFKNTTYIK